MWANVTKMKVVPYTKINSMSKGFIHRLKCRLLQKTVKNIFQFKSNQNNTPGYERWTQGNFFLLYDCL